jgi:hypothetical protein
MGSFSNYYYSLLLLGAYALPVRISFSMPAAVEASQFARYVLESETGFGKIKLFSES